MIEKDKDIKRVQSFQMFGRTLCLTVTNLPGLELNNIQRMKLSRTASL